MSAKGRKVRALLIRLEASWSKVFEGRFLMFSTVRSYLLVICITAVAMAIMQEQVHGGSVPAHRVVISFQMGTDNRVVLKDISWNEITKALPPSDELPKTKSPVSGFYYELKAKDGTVLYRRIAGNPIPVVSEGPKTLPEEETAKEKRLQYERKVRIPEQGVFSLIIPRAGVGDELVIYSSPLPNNKGSSRAGFGERGAVKEIARVPFVQSTPR